MQFWFCSSSTPRILKSILLNDLENKDIFPPEWEPNSDTDITFDSFTVSRTFTHQPRVDPPSALYWLEEMAWSLSPTLSKFQTWPDRADQFICLSKSKYVKNNHFQIEALRWFAAIANEYPTMSGAFTQLFNYHNKIKYSNSSILWKYHLPQRKNTKNVNSLGQLFMVIAMLCFPCLTKIQMSVHSINPNTCDSKELFQLKNVSTTSSKIVNVTFYLEYIFYTEKNVIPPTARSLYQIYIILAEGVTEFQNFIITQVFVFSRASLGPAGQAPKLSRKPAAAAAVPGRDW